MPHVDEGTLHAYLDGRTGGQAGGRAGGQVARAAGGAPAPTREVAEVEQHLSECAECRARLKDVRLVRDRATELLRRGVPASVREMPPFSEVLARAKARNPEPKDRRPGFRLTSPLAWAATVILAFGVGWSANRLSVGTTDRRVVGSADRRVELSPTQPAASPVVAARDPRENDAGGRATALAEGPTERREAERGATVGPARVADQARLDRPSAAPPAAPSPASPKAEEAKVVARSAAEAPQLADRLALRKEAANAAPSAAGLASNQLAAESTDESQWREVDRATAQATLGGSVVTVPEAGQPIFYVSLEAGATTVRVIQSLGAAGRLELVQDRLTAPPSTGFARRRDAAPEPGRANERRSALASAAATTIEANGLRITARGPLPPDSLRAMLERAVGR